MIAFSSDLFVWTGYTGVCDASDLVLPDRMHFHRRGVETFDVTSSKTGRTLTFHFVTELLDGPREDREIVGWRYHAFAGFIIDILND